MERANSNDLKLEEKDFLNLLTGSECFQDSGSNDFINILGFSRLSAINLPKAIELRPLPLATCEDPLKSAPKATKRADGCKKSPPHMTKPENMKCDAGVALLVSKPPYAALKPQRMSMLTRSLAQLRRTESAELAIQEKSLNLADKDSVGAGSTQPGILSRRRRFNSTSTLHIDSAAAEENLVKTLECLALIISRLVDQNPQDSESRNLVLSEAHHPISLKYQLNKKPLTSLQVFEFLNILFKTAEASIAVANWQFWELSRSTGFQNYGLGLSSSTLHRLCP